MIERLITCVSGSILSGMDICCFFWHSTHLFPKNIKLIRLPGCQLSNEQKIFPIFSPHKIRLNFIFWQGKCFCETFYNFKLNQGWEIINDARPDIALFSVLIYVEIVNHQEIIRLISWLSQKYANWNRKGFWPSRLTSPNMVYFVRYWRNISLYV